MWLEVDLPGELHDANRRIEAQEGAVGARGSGGHRGDEAGGTVTQRGIRCGEVRVVEGVESLDAESQAHLFGDLERAIDVQVEVEVMRPKHLIARCRRPRREVGDDGAVEVLAGVDAGNGDTGSTGSRGAATHAAPTLAERSG